MARRSGRRAQGAQIMVAASALIAGLVFVVVELRSHGRPFLPGFPVSIVAIVPDNPLAKSPPSAVSRVIHDPLALGAEAIVPEALGPAATPTGSAAAPPAPRSVMPPSGTGVAMLTLGPSAALRPAGPGPETRPLPAPIAHVAVPPRALPRPPEPGSEATWRRFAVPAGPEDGRPMIAIVIDDVGLDRPHSDEAERLPGPLTLSFMTYAEDLPAQVAVARAHGHEIMLHVPMEPLASRVDPGPNALTVALSQDEIKRRLDWDLARLDGIVGVNNHMGSRFTESSVAMTPVLATLRERGLFFLDSRTTPHSVGAELAASMGLPHAVRDIFLDDINDPAVASELAKTEAVARRNGFAIAIGHPHAPTMAELRRWLPDVEARGFRLVPVSAIVLHNESVAGRSQGVAASQ